jgi:hypothetical protein
LARAKLGKARDTAASTVALGAPSALRANAARRVEMRVLNVAEKPSAARTIASILSRGSAQMRPGVADGNSCFDFVYEPGDGSKLSMVSRVRHDNRSHLFAMHPP